MHSKTPLSLKPLWLLLAGVALVECAAHLLPEVYMTRTMQKMVGEIVSLRPAPVQIMGDSVAAVFHASTVARSALQPEGSVSNYCLPGTSPMFAYFTLKRQLQSAGPPRVIVYAPHPANLSSPMIDRFLGRFATASETGELLRNRIRLSEFLFGEACRASYTLRYREELQTVVTQGDLEFFRKLRFPAASVLMSQAPFEQPPLPVEKEHLFPASQVPPQLLQPFTVARENALYLDKFCDLAAEHHIPIAWVSPPTIAAIHDRPKGAESEARYFGFLKDMAARHSNVTILHAEIDVLPDAYFRDPWHLNPYGAWLYSRQLGEWLRPWLAPGVGSPSP